MQSLLQSENAVVRELFYFPCCSGVLLHLIFPFKYSEGREYVEYLDNRPVSPLALNVCVFLFQN